MTTAIPSTRTTPPVSDREETARRLLASSARKSYDPMVEVDWNAPLPTPSNKRRWLSKSGMGRVGRIRTPAASETCWVVAALNYFLTMAKPTRNRHRFPRQRRSAVASVFGPTLQRSRVRT